jgi:hypothetical protein
MPLSRASQVAALRAAGSRQSAFERREPAESPYGVVSVGDASAAMVDAAHTAEHGGVGARDNSNDDDLAVVPCARKYCKLCVRCTRAHEQVSRTCARMIVHVSCMQMVSDRSPDTYRRRTRCSLAAAAAFEITCMVLPV